MNKNALFALMLAAALVPATAEARTHHTSNRAEVIQDKRELRGDARDYKQDKAELARDMRQHDRSDIIRDRRELQGDRREIIQDRQELSRDARSQGYDRRNYWTGDRYHNNNRYDWGRNNYRDNNYNRNNGYFNWFNQ